MIVSNCLLLFLLYNEGNNYFKQVCIMSLGCHLASVLHAFVLLIWTTISLWKMIRMTCITLCNVQTPEFSPWCPEDLINSFSRASQKGIRILAVVKISNTKHYAVVEWGEITSYRVLELYAIYAITYCTTSYAQFSTKNCWKYKGTGLKRQSQILFSIYFFKRSHKQPPSLPNNRTGLAEY